MQGKRLGVSDPYSLAPTLILSHEIDARSPLHGLRDADLREADGAICVSVAAIDDHSLQASWPQQSATRLIGKPSKPDWLWHGASAGNRRAHDVRVKGRPSTSAIGYKALVPAGRPHASSRCISGWCVVTQEVYAKIVFEGDSIVWDHRFSVRAHLTSAKAGHISAAVLPSNSSRGCPHMQRLPPWTAGSAPEL